MVILNLMFGEIVLRTKEKHRLSGYAREYLGPELGKVSVYAFTATIWGAMLAYVIVGGSLLYTLLSPLIGGAEWMYATALSVLVLLVSRRGTVFASRLEAWVVAGILFIFFWVALAAAPHVELTNLLDPPSHMLAAYGVILFSLSGAGVIAELRDVLGAKQERLLPKVIIYAMGIIVLLYAMFTFAVLGAMGDAVTPSAVVGISTLLGANFGVIITLLGIATVFSVFLVHAVQMQNSFKLDVGVGARKAWLLSIGVPLVLYLLGARAFISTIGFVGAVLGGVVGIFIVITYESMRRSVVCRSHKCLQVPAWVSAVLIGMFALGILLELGSLVAVWIS